MSSKRSRSRSSSSRVSSKLNKSNNVQLYKLLDPVVQSVGFIFFLYCLDAQTHFSYRMVMMLLIGWQLLSVLINFFLGELKLLKTERIAYFIIMLLYLAVFFYFRRNVKESYIALDQGLKPTVPLKQVILMTVGMVIAFWYNVICYREFKKIFGAINRGNNR